MSRSHESSAWWGNDEPVLSNDDEELMQQVAGGDLQAFGQLVGRHQQAVWRIAFRLLGDPAEAEDAAQQAFLKIFEAAPRYRPTAAFRTYLHCVVTRHCLDRMEKKKPIYTDAAPKIEDQHLGPAAQLEAKEQRAAVLRAVDDLPQSQRTAVVLFHFEGLSYKEVADLMQISAKAVERLLARGRAALACALEDMSVAKVS